MAYIEWDQEAQCWVWSDKSGILHGPFASYKEALDDSSGDI